MQAPGKYNTSLWRAERASRRHLIDRNAYGRRTRENSGNTVGYIGKERETVPEQVIVPAAAITLFPGDSSQLRGPALTYWFTEGVINVLVYDGPFEYHWSAADIARNGVSHREYAVPFDQAIGNQYATPNGALHGSSGSYLCPDPFRVKGRHANGPSADFFNMVHDFVQRMSISDTMLIAAASYLSRLAVHGSGSKGAELRTLLRMAQAADPEGSSYPVERRVAFLAIWLSYRYFSEDHQDDTANGAVIAGIPKGELVRLDRAAMIDLGFALNLDHHQWMAHLAQCADNIGRYPARSTHLDAVNQATIGAVIEHARYEEYVRSTTVEWSKQEGIRRRREWATEIAQAQAAEQLSATVSPVDQAAAPRSTVAPRIPFNVPPRVNPPPGFENLAPRQPRRHQSENAVQPEIQLIGYPPGLAPTDNVIDADDDDEPEWFTEYDGARPFIATHVAQQAEDSHYHIPASLAVDIDEDDDAEPYTEYDGAQPFGLDISGHVNLSLTQGDTRSVESWRRSISSDAPEAVAPLLDEVDGRARSLECVYADTVGMAEASMPHIRQRSAVQRREPGYFPPEAWAALDEMDERDAQLVYRSLDMAPAQSQPSVSRPADRAGIKHFASYPSRDILPGTVNMAAQDSQASLATVASSQGIATRMPRDAEAEQGPAVHNGRDNQDIDMDDVQDAYDTSMENVEALLDTGRFNPFPASPAPCAPASVSLAATAAAEPHICRRIEVESGIEIMCPCAHPVPTGSAAARAGDVISNARTLQPLSEADRPRTTSLLNEASFPRLAPAPAGSSAAQTKRLAVRPMPPSAPVRRRSCKVFAFGMPLVGSSRRIY